MSAGEHARVLGSEDAAEDAILPAVSCNRHSGITAAREKNRHSGITAAREMAMAQERM